MMMRLTRILVVSALAMPAAAPGQGWQFGYDAASPIAVPSWLRVDSLRQALGYEPGEQLAGFRLDLNGDSVPDLVLRFSRNVCGTNCQYALVDARTRRTLGVVGGTVIVIHTKLLNAYPVIDCYGHSSAESGYWSSWVYDGHEYVAVSSVYVEGESQAKSFEAIRDVPSVVPGKRPPNDG
jgi:hypothetical protein